MASLEKVIPQKYMYFAPYDANHILYDSKEEQERKFSDVCSSIIWTLSKFFSKLKHKITRAT